MDRWRKYFRCAGTDIWTVCERALALAYLDNAEDFASQRDRLAQKLFAPEKLDLQEMEEDPPEATPTMAAAPHESGGIDDDEEEDVDAAVTNSSEGEDQESEHRPLSQHGSTLNGHYDQAQALTEEMEEESLLKRDVFELKETILDSYKSEREVFDSLQRLELMQLSFDALKETEIGKAVNSLRKHSSAKVRALVKQLVSDWKDTADHWYKSVKDVTQASMAVQSESPSEREEHGLPSPPMDEGALLAGRSASIEMSQLFDFMDDDTSAGAGVGVGDVTCQTHSIISKKSGSVPPSNKQGEFRSTLGRRASDSDARKKEREVVMGTNGYIRKDREERATTNGHESRRESEKWLEKKAYQLEINERGFTPGVSNPVHSSKPAVESKEMEQKFLAAKRKLQENYQQAESAKKQRTIQVMELEDLPKGGPKRSKPLHVARGGKPVSQQHRPQAFRR